MYTYSIFMYMLWISKADTGASALPPGCQVVAGVNGPAKSACDRGSAFTPASHWEGLSTGTNTGTVKGSEVA
jgi:hypothetical protein